jgi:hypothetical protein
MQALALVLGQNHDLEKTSVDEIREREVDQPILATKRDRRFGTIASQRTESLSLAAGENDRQRTGPGHLFTSFRREARSLGQGPHSTRRETSRVWPT